MNFSVYSLVILCLFGTLPVFPLLMVSSFSAPQIVIKFLCFKMEQILINKQAVIDLVKIKEEFDNIIESIELMSNKEFMKSYKRSKEQIKNKEFANWDEM